MKASILSKKSKYARFAIREDDAMAEKLSKTGRKVLKLSGGDPAAYFPTPAYIINPYIKALRNHKTAYARSQGTHELVDAIIGRYKRKYGLTLSDEDVIVTNGVAEAITFINSAMIDDNDKAILFKPYYPQYISSLKTYGGIEILEYYDEKLDWNINTDSLERSLKKIGKHVKNTKYMLLTNPNNPTGTVLDRKVLEEIVDLANEYNIFLISDEVYDELTYNGAKYTSICKLASGIPYMVLNGASKAFDASGFRIGYAIIPGDDNRSIEVKDKLVDYAMVRLSANTPAQYAIAEAMNNVKEHEKAVNRMISSIERSTNSSVDLLEENTFLDVVRPKGAFYIFPRLHMKDLKFRNDKEFVETLLKEERIQTVRGSGFGSPNHFRIVSLAPERIMRGAIEKINGFCKRHAR